MKNVVPKTRAIVLKNLFGKNQQSNFGQYKYQINGIIPDGAYIKPVRATLIVQKRYIQKVSKLFDSYEIKYRIFEIKVSRSDFERKDLLFDQNEE